MLEHAAGEELGGERRGSGLLGLLVGLLGLGFRQQSFGVQVQRQQARLQRGGDSGVLARARGGLRFVLRRKSKVEGDVLALLLDRFHLEPKR